MSHCSYPKDSKTLIMQQNRSTLSPKELAPSQPSSTENSLESIDAMSYTQKGLDSKSYKGSTNSDISSTNISLNHVTILNEHQCDYSVCGNTVPRIQNTDMCIYVNDLQIPMECTTESTTDRATPYQASISNQL